MRKGPINQITPARVEKVCNGCEFLCKITGMRGHKKCTNSFLCTHEDFENEYEQLFTQEQGGRLIHFNIEGDCGTPSWCPFKNKNVSNGQQAIPETIPPEDAKQWMPGQWD